MFLPGWLVVGFAIFPLVALVRANRTTSLIYASVWAAAAWAGWLTALTTGWMSWWYLALGLTGCAGVAVFGARRPGAAAWNFVVGGLLIVLILPLAEAGALDAPVRPGTMRTVFLVSLVGMIVINYLPTRLTAGAGIMAVGCGFAIARVAGIGPVDEPAGWYVGLAPFAAWLGLWKRADSGSAGDRLWRAFRDRYGLIWGLRLREQFNRAATNAGLTCELRWTGLSTADAEACELLAVLTQRFLGPPNGGVPDKR